jgi:hypothetical protein
MADAPAAEATLALPDNSAVAGIDHSEASASSIGQTSSMRCISVPLCRPV